MVGELEERIETGHGEVTRSRELIEALDLALGRDELRPLDHFLRRNRAVSAVRVAGEIHLPPLVNDDDGESTVGHDALRVLEHRYVESRQHGIIPRRRVGTDDQVSVPQIFSGSRVDATSFT